MTLRDHADQRDRERWDRAYEQAEEELGACYHNYNPLDVPPCPHCEAIQRRAEEIRFGEDR